MLTGPQVLLRLPAIAFPHSPIYIKDYPSVAVPVRSNFWDNLGDADRMLSASSNNAVADGLGLEIVAQGNKLWRDIGVGGRGALSTGNELLREAVP